MCKNFRILGLLAFFLLGIVGLNAQTYWPMSQYSEEESYKTIFLDDTNYYVSRDYVFADYGKYYTQYFLSTSALTYEFKDGLPDGKYVLVALFREKANTLPDNIVNRYIVATGNFENGMKHGKFTFSAIHANSTETDEVESKSEYKSIDFTNDIVNGTVQEYFDGALYHLAQYKMGKLDGYYIIAGHTTTLLKIYQDGILIKELTF